MNKIKTLNDTTISQIAAGEIIENPASVCKELIENSIDAGATNITVQLGDSLVDFIRITDNGQGISKEDLPFAFMRHATSKLNDVSDLNDILTLGFRGEALASIANISQVEIITKTKDVQIASKAILAKGEVQEIVPIGAPQGTSILVKDLFYNTPVRKKYLKSVRSELENIVSTIETIALGHNNIAFQLIYKAKIILQSHPSGKRINHIFSLLGKEIASNLIPIEFDSESYKIEGYISNNSLHRSTAQKEYIFINGRSVKSREISKAIRSLYHTLIPLQRYPIFILYINLDPLLVDVNIHPQKQYVRLSNENYIIDILKKLVRGKLEPNRRIPDFKVQEKKIQAEEVKDQTIFEIAMGDKKNDSFIPPIEDPLITREENNSLKTDNNLELSNMKEEFTSKESSLSYENILNFDSIRDFEKTEKIDLDKIDYIGNLFKTYLFFENKETTSLILVDQHAAHERILFEKFYDELINQEIHRQLLLSPLVFKLSSKDHMKLLDHLEEFNNLGFHLEVFGDSNVILREVPSSILISNYETFIFDSLLELDEGKGIVEQNIYKIMRMACRKAIKGGDRIDSMQANALLVDLLKARNPYSCPHGRPTMLNLSKRMIEKMFLREG